MLFNVYLDEALRSNPFIWKIFNQERGLAYADDLMIKLSSLKETEIIIQEFSKIESQWGLRINRKKCEILRQRINQPDGPSSIMDIPIKSQI